MADGGDVEQMIDRVVLEQFTTRLPKKTAEWVQCHRPTSLDSAIQLAEDHLVACPGVGEPLPSVSLSPSLPPLSLSRPVPLPRSRPPGPPRVPPRGRGGTDSQQFVAPRAPPRGAGLATAGLDPAPASPLSPRQSFGPFSATGAAGRSGLACWRCGDPDHFIDRCPVMEVGTLIRVPDDLQVAPGQAGQYQIP
ncbi:actin cytoskeleton-regulatory complex protein pan1-like [Megalobrama amblycephala]|uniref:actin cytoskeleton-regulatory complex protein pan1-like n=1 Tax=Megalobrama amblycephala TaxID=75352 RepID=UPI002013E9AA|nr:actin cytoskeleton-regulatory complex protein pan1-like [Megalobrama amblycephala]